MEGEADRYARQSRFEPVGPHGQARIRAGRVLVVGCGGLGSNSADLLARAGVGLLRIVDRDVVELSNLHRQALFDERDARDHVPKAVAAARHLKDVNAEVRVEPVVTDVEPRNILPLLDGIDIVVDGLDSFEGRYLLNDACVMRGLPWVYGACVASTAMALPIFPGHSPCLRCIHDEMPGPGAADTCDTAGILGPAAVLAASLQTALALRYLVDGHPPAEAALLCADVWTPDMQRLPLSFRDPGRCPCCGLRRFEFLETPASPAVVLCGRDAVRVAGLLPQRPDFQALSARLKDLGDVRVTEHVLLFRSPPYQLTLFEDGRAIVKGTDDPACARGLVARWIGV